MKRRTGLVSNSSSSSYIIALKKDVLSEKCPHCGRGGEYDLLQATALSYDMNTEVISDETSVTIERLESRYNELADAIYLSAPKRKSNMVGIFSK